METGASIRPCSRRSIIIQSICTIISQFCIVHESPFLSWLLSDVTDTNPERPGEIKDYTIQGNVTIRLSLSRFQSESVFTSSLRVIYS